jgi:hypothetical protein
MTTAPGYSRIPALNGFGRTAPRYPAGVLSITGRLTCTGVLTAGSAAITKTRKNRRALPSAGENTPVQAMIFVMKGTWHDQPDPGSPHH